MTSQSSSSSTTATTSSSAIFLGGAVAAVAAAYVLARSVPWFKVGYAAFRIPAIGRRLHARQLSACPPPPPPSLVHRCGAATVTAIPFMRDNYAYLVRCERTGHAVLVDPADPDRCATVAEAHVKLQAQQRGQQQQQEQQRGQQPIGGGGDASAAVPAVSAVLATHWHPDHSFGNAPLRERYPGLEVHAPRADRVHGTTHAVDVGDIVRVGALEFEVLRGSGHTAGGVMFLLRTCTPAVVFTGDAVFSGGIGALFEGDAAEMARTLDGFAALPAATEVLTGHEYTVASLKFAQALLPGDPAIEARLAWARTRQFGTRPPRPTVPSSVSEELRHNVFLRTGERQLGDRALALLAERGLSLEGDPATTAAWPHRTRVLAAIRRLKDAGFGTDEDPGGKEQ
jgi:hydroxyacylglutathione hydrolase